MVYWSLGSYATTLLQENNQESKKMDEEFDQYMEELRKFKPGKDKNMPKVGMKPESSTKKGRK